ncbi:MAG: dCTP deaminase, partial [Campylobacter sp.]|nr:dCTP deaminase [Campylobacter sp.]
MGLKSDKWIRQMSVENEMITPFCEENVGKGVVSYGVSSYGYDIRVGNEFKIFTHIGGTVVDPKNFDEKNVVDFVGDVC